MWHVAGASDVGTGTDPSNFTRALVARVLLPATSETEALAVSADPLPVITESSGQVPAMPDKASLHVQWMVTSPLYQPSALGPVVGAPVIVGGVSSTLMGVLVTL